MTTHLRDLTFTPAEHLGVLTLRFGVEMSEFFEEVEMTGAQGRFGCHRGGVWDVGCQGLHK